MEGSGSFTCMYLFLLQIHQIFPLNSPWLMRGVLLLMKYTDYLIVNHVPGLCQIDEGTDGLHIGKFTTYAHQIQGQVYAINEYTFRLKNFYYDGNGRDTFFWAGSTSNPSNVGFIIPDDEGKTNKLIRYRNADFTLTLPDGKKITDIKWLSVYDLTGNQNFADVYVPEGFNVPAPQRLSEFSSHGAGVKSGTIVILDSKTIKIPDFYFVSTNANVFFWVGGGPFPTAAGRKIPDEGGYLNPLHTYNGKDIELEMPGNLTVFRIKWLAVWNVDEEKNYGSINIPDGLNIPPSLVKVIKSESLVNCEQLHKNLQLQWDVFSPAVTFTLIANIGNPAQQCDWAMISTQMKMAQSLSQYDRARFLAAASPKSGSWLEALSYHNKIALISILNFVDDDDYVAFGVSGSEEKSQMRGSDVSLSYMTGLQGRTDDYNITDRAPCTNSLGKYQGVCPDVKVGGQPNFQTFLSVRKDGITKFVYRRSLLNTADHGDKTYETDREQYFVWAIGKMNSLQQPGFHHTFPKVNHKHCVCSGDVKLNLGREKTTTSCFDFTTRPQTLPSKWGPFYIHDKNIDTFTVRVGPAGGLRGYFGHTGVPSSGHVFYVNGLLAPEIYVKRGNTYSFVVEAGNNPHDALFYHPLYITENPYGALSDLNQKEIEAEKLKIITGIKFSRRGRIQPTTAGRLCLWKLDKYTSLDADNFPSFARFRGEMTLHCDTGNSATLKWTPNITTPDTLYYQSYSHPSMGWKINVVDEFDSEFFSSAVKINLNLALFCLTCFILLFKI
ncbi:Protein Skeletor, isoforms B/C [Nymphon striatum]|nr:Protein Skeletor, isoforms B/C [Nymphon striatum]